jgi:hypothetical protein
MPVKVKIELNGIEALKAEFKKLPAEVQKRAALPATRAAAQVAAKAVRAESPVGNHKGRKFDDKGNKGIRYAGTLKNSIQVKRIKRFLKPNEVGHIVVIHPIAYYYAFVVNGFVAKGTAVPPNPFIDRADNASKAAQQAAFDQVFSNTLVLVLAKLNEALKRG